MRNDKNKALKFRLQGRSYSEITKLLGVPKSTLSGWFVDLELSDLAKERLNKKVYEKSIKAIIKRNKLQTHLAKQRAREIRELSRKEIEKLSKRDLFILGVALYWAEGYKRPIVIKNKIKTHHPVSLTNSDPKLVKIYLKFLREVCKVPEKKIKAGLRIYQHQNENYLLEFWSKITNIPHNRFGKMYYGVSKSSLNKRPYNILPYGTVQIRVSSTGLYHRIMGWIEGLSNI